MARSLTYAVDQRMQQARRRPAFKVLLYDFRTSGDTLGLVVRDELLATDTGPLDITANVLAVDLEEVAGDFVSSGIPSSSATLRIVDDTPGGQPSRWDPQESADDDSAPARFLRRGNGIRIYEGDADVDPLDWPIIFTGRMVGQAGVDRGRAIDAAGRSLISAVFSDRSADFANQKRTSEEFAQGASYITMGTEVATNLMGLDIEEIEFSGWGSRTTGLAIQFIDQSPLVSLAQLMLPDGFLPRFSSQGKLTQTSADIAKSPARIYGSGETIRHIGKPFSQLDPVNSVEVIGLEAEKTKVAQQRQPLAEVGITTGYFTYDEEVNVYWSADRTQLAENVKLDIQRSVNGGLSILGGGESFDLIPAESTPAFSVGATLRVGTGFAPYIAVFFAVGYVALAWVPDEVVVGLVAGVTIPVGRVAQAIALAAILAIMSKIGRGQYVFLGDPVEFVYKEIRSIAELDGLTSENLNRVTIENHLIQTQANCDNVAKNVLFQQQARGNPRSIVALCDLRVEPNDVIETADGRRYMIERASRTLSRDPNDVQTSWDSFEVTPGLAP